MESENQNTESGAENKAPEDEQKKPKKNHAKIKKISLVILIILLLGGIAGVAYLWNDERSHNKEISTELTEKEKQLEALAEEAEKSKEKLASLINNQNKQANQKTSYSASVGKFTLTLSDDYYIIKKLDGGFEGGPATVLEIGETTSDFRVVDSLIASETEVRATPKGLNGPFDQWVKNQVDNSGSSNKIDNVTIDGVSAEHYTLLGLNETHAYYFQKNDIYYSIRSPQAANPDTAVYDVIQGFKFN